jgi:hypothetical protein
MGIFCLGVALRPRAGALSRRDLILSNKKFVNERNCRVVESLCRTPAFLVTARGPGSSHGSSTRWPQEFTSMELAEIGDLDRFPRTLTSCGNCVSRIWSFAATRKHNRCQRYRGIPDGWTTWSWRRCINKACQLPPTTQPENPKAPSPVGLRRGSHPIRMAGGAGRNRTGA